jgi:hypothetical protein
LIEANANAAFLRKDRGGNPQLTVDAGTTLRSMNPRRQRRE